MPVSFANFGAFAMDFTFDDIACRLFMAIETFLAMTAVRLESRDRFRNANLRQHEQFARGRQPDHR